MGVGRGVDSVSAWVLVLLGPVPKPVMAAKEQLLLRCDEGKCTHL